ncbi:MAG: SMC-Scp complex subunit ScpB [Candidatus Marinimicrobia bacterium CG08_land_8_20_14_0_20_45_22]|nr:MAG: SMC-Scp complex subunit ScpB [Candidatus Marinimicrobia bacterium CG08_land_8_20_14_0_20_45_22]
MLSPTHKIIEALLFSASEPITNEQAKVCLQEEIDLAQIVGEINEYYEQEKSPIWIQSLSGGYRLMTRSEYDPWISRLFQSKGNLRLSRPALETLSIIAYKQPVTRTEIDSIRGVTTVLKPLIEKNLIETKGRQEGPGRALLYGTTSHFLEYFGLATIKDLPKIKEIEEIMHDEPGESVQEREQA